MIVRGLLLLFVVVGEVFAAFEPRTKSERREALGDLSTAAPEFRRLLTPDDDFDLIPLPEPGDWLSIHVEPGQTFDEFIASKPNRPNVSRRIIYLLPIEEFDSESSPAIEVLSEYARIFFQMEVKVLPVYRPDAMEFEPRVNTNTGQVQVLTTRVLAFLRKRLPSDAFCLLGITMQDLYPHPSWNFVFGLASTSTRVGVYSFARYDPEFFGEERPQDFRRTILRRSCRVLTHETGHMFGLLHCIYYDCVLNGSNSLAESDARTIELCPVCLRKLQWSTAFDPVKRYRELAAFFQKHGWTEDADWCEQQVQKSTR
jgi:archaemetzincin